MRSLIIRFSGYLLLFTIPIFSFQKASAQCDFLHPDLYTASCAGAEIALYSYEDEVTYYLYKNGQSISSIQGSSYISFGIQQAGSYAIWVQKGACPLVQTGGNFTLSPLPSNVLVESDGGNTRCGYVDLSTRFQSGETYQWHKDGNPVGGATQSYLRATVTGNYSVVVSNGGCHQTSGSVSVTVLPYPAPEITSNGSSFCEGDQVSLTVPSPNGSYAYDWYKTNGTHVGSGLSYTATETGTYLVQASNGYCNAPSNSIAITINPYPDASITPSGAQTICSTCSVLLNAGTGTNYTYQWKKSGSSISGATASSYLAAESGNFTVEVTAGVCKSTTVTPFQLNVNIAPFVYGGPAVAMLIPQHSVTLHGSYSDADGSIVFHAWTKVSGPAVTMSGNSTPDLALTNLVEGTYVFRIEARDNFGESRTSHVTVSVNSPPNNFNYVREIVLQEPLSTISTPDGLTASQKIENTTYFDGLGRAIQTVTTQGTPSLHDIVQPMAYDPFGREDVKYLPYASGESNGWYKSTFVAKDHPSYPASEQHQFYQTTDNVAHDTHPFAKTIFEPSSLNRIVKQGAPGEAWQPDNNHSYTSGDHTIKNDYQYNGTDEVLLWTYTYPATPDALGLVEASVGTTPVYYPASELYKNKTKDEGNHEVITYTDKEGHTILKKVQADATTYAETYYIYDDFSNLVCVIQPEGVRQIVPVSSAYFGKTYAEKHGFLKQWAFRYTYDSKRRLVQKQVPGAEAVYMIYDDRDRVVLTQDGNQRSNNQWAFTKYDTLNRTVVTGLYNHGSSVDRQTMAGLVSPTKFCETYNSTAEPHGYTNHIFPAQNLDVHTVTYYDNYAFKPLILINNAAYHYKGDEIASQRPAAFDQVAGQVTGSKTRILGGSAYLWSVNYYDDKYRVIQTITDHHKGTVRMTNVYDFTGKLLHTQRKYTVEGTLTTVKESFGYDHAGRQLSVMHSIDGGTPVAMVTNEYNELGQLITKKLNKTMSGTYVTADPAVGQPGVAYGNNIELFTYNSAQHTQIATNSIRLRNSNSFHVPYGSIFKGRIGFSQQDADAHNSTVHEIFLQTIDYRYNIRGWLNKINDPATPQSDDLFNMELRYNNPAANGGTAQYNGNISEAVWKSAGMDKQSYGYYYDDMNRITEAKYFNTARPLINGRYDEKIGAGANRPGYDLNGNILNLLRKGKTAKSNYGLMDDLHYDYSNSGNKLMYVSDAQPLNALEEGFKEISGSEGIHEDYGYDDNGNMIRDDNKGIIDIDYNHLNLPSKVSKSASEYIIYTYDAMGRKLSQQVFGTTPKTTDYIGDLVYEGNSLQFISHSEGRAVKDNSPQAPDPWEYQYFLKDHLGNTRVVFSEKKSSTEYKATMETNRQAEEQQVFKKYNALGALNLFDHTDDGTAYTKSHLLNGGNNYQVGLAKSFTVNPGDVIDLEVYAKYEAVTSPPANTVSNLLSGLISAFSLGAGTTPIDGSQAQTAFTNLFPGGGPWINSTKWEDSGAPKAYLNYILFNDSLQLVDFGFDQISAGAKQTGLTPDVDHDYLSLHVKVQKKGYLYIYVSNENPVQTNVYFDDMKIVHYTAVEQVNDYYPFGLTFNSYNRENSVPQDYKYNSKEEQTELGLGWLDYGARMYRPELGRFFTQDRFAGKYLDSSPYSYGLNNPALYVDINGDSVWTTTQSRSDADGNVTITNTIHITGKVLKQNSGKSTAQGVAIGLNARLNSQKDTSDPKKNANGTTTTTITKINANFTAASSMNDVSSSDHLVVIVDNVTGQADPKLGGGEAGGQAVLGGQIAYTEDAGAVETAFHEVGHNLGMTHPDSNNGNPMSYNGDGNNFSSLQLMQTYNRARNGALNQGSNSAVMGTQFPGIPHGQFFSPTTTQNRPFMVAPDKRARIPLPLIN